MFKQPITVAYNQKLYKSLYFIKQQTHEHCVTLDTMILWVCVCVCTYREEDDGNGECYGSQHGETHTQKHRVKLINLGKRVQQLRLHIICVSKCVFDENN